MKYRSLYLFSLETSPQTWFLIFHHGKANEVGQDVLEELELLNQELESPQSPQCLISLSLRQSRSGKQFLLQEQMSPNAVTGQISKLRSMSDGNVEILQDLRNAPLFHICLINGLALVGVQSS